MWKRKYRIQLRTKQKEGEGNFPLYKEKRNEIKKKSLTAFKKEIKEIILKRTNFHRYLFSRIFYCATLPAMGLYAVYCQNKFNFNISEVGLFTILNVISMGVFSYASGHLGDKYGHKNSMLLAYVGHLLAALIAMNAWNMYGVYLIFIAIGIGHDVTRYYKNAVTIHRAEELGGAMLEQLTDLFKVD